MSTFAIVHGAAGCAWEWHLVRAELEAAGHRVVVPDLPCEDDGCDFGAYADLLVDALGAPADAADHADGPDAGTGGRPDVVVVAHSAGGFAGTLVAERIRPRALVLCAAMVPAPGESGGQWWTATGHDALPEPAGDAFWHDLPGDLRAQVAAHERGQSETPFAAPFPLPAWPNVPTRAILFADDRCFPPPFMRALYADRLGITDPTVVPGGHCAYLSHPRELAAVLLGVADGGPVA